MFWTRWTGQWIILLFLFFCYKVETNVSENVWAGRKGLEGPDGPPPIKVEECPVLRMAMDVFLRPGPSGKVDMNNRKETCTHEQISKKPRFLEHARTSMQALGRTKKIDKKGPKRLVFHHCAVRGAIFPVGIRETDVLLWQFKTLWHFCSFSSVTKKKDTTIHTESPFSKGGEET